MLPGRFEARLKSNNKNPVYTALYISPMIPSYNIQETAHFLKDVLGFSPVLETSTYAICIKDNLTIHIVRAGKEIGEMEFYIEVDHVDRVWDDIKEKLTGLKVKEPFDRAYGMREIHIEIPQTKTLLFIGQQLAPTINLQ
jgi:catechol 2,3-dioxygenase-like lactoylglutathione lyase family enzyme